MASPVTDKPMGILQHLEEIRRRFRIVVVVFMAVFVFTFAFDIRPGDPVPIVPDFENSIASRVFNATVQHLNLPPDVSVAVGGPFEAVMVQLKVALFLAVSITLPTAAYQLGMFIRPALRPKERRIILRIVAPVVVLFLLGVGLAYFVMLPPMFQFLYQIPDSLGVSQKLLFIDPLIDFLLLFTLGLGAAFQLPVIMWTLAAVGFTSPAFWARHWRFAVFGFFVFGALITPDGTGFTMLMVALPMIGLFGVGYLAARLAWQRHAAE